MIAEGGWTKQMRDIFEGELTVSGCMAMLANCRS